MHNFEEWLRDALIDANLLQFEKVLADADIREFNFSPQYLRERVRILAAPFSWAKRRSRSVWYRAAQKIACILLTCTVVLGALMAASPAVRAAVLNWLREFGRDMVTYSTNPHLTGSAPADAGPQDWRLTWLPEGYALQDLYLSPGISKWFFWSDEFEASVDFGCSAPGKKSSVQVGTIPDPEGARENIFVRGISADYYAGDSHTKQLLVWETPEGFLLHLLAKGQIDRETLVQIAESAACYGSSAPAYEMGWVPPDFQDMDMPLGNGAACQQWVRRGVTLSWQYLVDPACPFTAPEEAPEEVTIGSLPGRFWASQEEIPEVSGAPDDSVVHFGSITAGVSSAPEEEITSTLMWEAPETNTAFCLRGALEKSDLLRMAESVKRRDLSIESSQPGRFEIISGTACEDPK